MNTNLPSLGSYVNDPKPPESSKLIELRILESVVPLIVSTPVLASYEAPPYGELSNAVSPTKLTEKTWRASES